MNVRSLVPGGFDVMLDETSYSSNNITVKNEIVLGKGVRSDTLRPLQTSQTFQNDSPAQGLQEWWCCTIYD